MIPRRKSFGNQEEVVREAIGSAKIVEAMIIYHMIAPSPTSKCQAQARRTMKMIKMPSTTRRAQPKRNHQTRPTTRRRVNIILLVNEWVTGGETSSESSESEEDKNKKIAGIAIMDDEEPPLPPPPMCFMAKHSKGFHYGNLYLVDFASHEANLTTCLISKTSKCWLWHHRIAHIVMSQLKKAFKKGMILGVKDVTFEKDKLCSACQAGKQVASHHPMKAYVSTTRPLELIHMNLFGPTTYKSLGSNLYCLVIVDKYSRCT
jgi:hypothetical protein